MESKDRVLSKRYTFEELHDGERAIWKLENNDNEFLDRISKAEKERIRVRMNC